MQSKGLVNHKSPKKVNHLKENTKQTFIGAGPRQSLDQKISFVNENNNLAQRIMSVGQRKDFLSGLLQKNALQTRTSFNNSRYGNNSLISHRKNKRSVVELPGINH